MLGKSWFDFNSDKVYIKRGSPISLKSEVFIWLKFDQLTIWIIFLLQNTLTIII